MQKVMIVEDWSSLQKLNNDLLSNGGKVVSITRLVAQGGGFIAFTPFVVVIEAEKF